MDYLGGPHVITRVFMRERSRRVREGDVMMEAGVRVSERDWKMLTAGFEAGGRGHEPKKAGSL